MEQAYRRSQGETMSTLETREQVKAELRRFGWHKTHKHPKGGALGSVTT
jgi:hypothetical protein